MKTIRYDPETEVLFMKGGTEDDPITDEDIKRVCPNYMDEKTGKIVVNLKIRDACLNISR